MQSNETKDTKRRSFLAKLGAVVFGAAFFGAFKKNHASPALSNPPAMGALMSPEPYMGSIGIFAGNFAPRGWAFCNGQLLSIAQNQALFSLLGTTYGGNGQTNFALPDLRGRAPIHFGQGPGQSYRTLGENGGYENHTLTIQETPAHTHAGYGSQNSATSDNPSGLLPAVNTEGGQQYASGNTAALNSGAIGIAGGSQPHNNMPPFLTLNYCIAIQGIFPSQS